MKIYSILVLPLLAMSACSNASAPAPASTRATPETVCAKRGFQIGSPEYAECVTRENGYRRMENFRKENEQQELYRDFDRARRF